MSSSDTKTVEVGSVWRKNLHGVWRPTPNDVHDVRVEAFTPLGRVVLRRLDCEHEFIFDVSTLTEAFDLLVPSVCAGCGHDLHAAGDCSTFFGPSTSPVIPTKCMCGRHNEARRDA